MGVRPPLDDAQKARVRWLIGYIRGAIMGMWQMTNNKDALDSAAHDEIVQAVADLEYLVERMMQ